MDVIIIGAGPAGVFAARRAAELGAKTTLITRDEFGGMGATDGPVPVRTLAHAARLIREARQLGQYGIAVSEPMLEYPRLLARVREVVTDVRTLSLRREDMDRLGVTVYEKAGTAGFLDPHTIETESGLRLEADKIILCAGGMSRRLSVPGFELTATHSDAWSATAVPPSMLVIGGGATGVQLASIFNAFGSEVQLFQAGPRILPTEDEDVSAAVAAAFRRAGIAVREGFGTIESFEKTPSGVRMVFSKEDARDSAEAAAAFVAVGWVADSAGLNLARAGVETDARGYVRVELLAADFCAARLRSGRHHRPPDVGSAGDRGRLGGSYERRARRDDNSCGPGKSNRQLHRPGICPSRPDRGEGPRNPRCGCCRGALRRDHPHDYRRPDGRVLQADRRPRDLRDPGLPRCWRAGGRDRPGGCGRHCRRDASGRPGPGSALISHLCRYARARGIPCRPAAQSGSRRPSVPPCVSRVDDSAFALSDEFSVLRARDYVAFSRRKRQQ